MAKRTKQENPFSPEAMERARREEQERAAILAQSYPIQGDVLATAQFASQMHAIWTYEDTLKTYGSHERALATAARYVDACNTMRAAISAPPLQVCDVLKRVWQGPQPN